MPTTFTTIAIASQPHARNTEPKKRAPLTAEQRRENQDKRQTKQAAIDAAIANWWDSTIALADDLASRYKQKRKYFLELMFQGGARMVNHQEKINPYNAFKAEKAAECRDRGESKDGPELHDEYFDEYKNLTTTEKDALVERFRLIRDREPKLRRDTPRAKIQDVANIVRNMKLLMVGLGNRVGIEGFFCIVRNSPDFHMQPQWFFTSRELEQYMPIATRRKWVTSEVGTKMEAFAVAGCDVLNLLRTSKQKADFLKAGIREGISEKLITITGDANAQMQYVWYEEDIVLKYGIILVGWTFPEIVNPSELSTSLPGLQELYDAIKNDTCKFEKLSSEAKKARRAKWAADVEAGRMERKHRETRSDKGVKRKQPAGDDMDEDNGDAGGDDDEEADSRHDSSASAIPAKPPTKRRRITAKLPEPVVEEPRSDADEQGASPAIEKPVGPRKRKPAAKKAAAAPKKAATAPKQPAGAPKKTAAAKSATKKGGPRDDEVTRAVTARLTAERVAKQAAAAGGVDAAVPTTRPRPRPRPAYSSRAIITSDDEENNDPNADKEDDTSMALITLRVPLRRATGAIVTSDDEVDDDPDANEADDVGMASAAA
ncbi:hypothetical protein B0H11DRAFT_2193174 [Mycena galericulata]|nr:hypothetical protein B0H11DRAFT_2193174 [Mycena galericulata]